VSKLKALLAKAKEALALSQKRNQLLQLKMNELEIESQRSALIRRKSLTGGSSKRRHWSENRSDDELPSTDELPGELLGVPKLVDPEAEKRTKERVSLTLHLQKLELLSKAIASLPRVNRIDIDTNSQNLQLHLKRVDEVTTTLDRAMQFAVQDARMLVAGHKTATIAQKKQDHRK
jgi:hypothetical protein